MANRLQNADGPWGSKTFYYDGVGNRTFENSTVAGTTTSDQCTYPATSNRIQSIVRNGSTTLRAFLRGLVTQKTDGRGILTNMTYDNAGRILTKTFPAATAENLDYTYDSTVNSNKGIGRLTKINDEPGSIDLKYDERGNVIREDRNIAGFSNPVTYEFDLADQPSKVNYPSGRIVTYYRDSAGRINKVTTKQNATAVSVTLLNNIVYQPISNLIKSLTYANGLTESNVHTLDYEQSQCTVSNGATTVAGQTWGRTDLLNITSQGDTVTPANNQSFGYSAANRLNSASGPYGSKAWTYDGVGNRTSETNAGVLETYSYPATSNKLQSVLRTGVTPNPRDFTYDGAGNIATDARSGVTFTYTYNNANRLKTVSQSGNLLGTYTYNGREQLATRAVTNSGSANGTIHTVHDQWGNIIAELDATGATVREYIWLVEAEIAPTRGSRTTVDRPIAVVSNVNTTPALLMVHVDHLNRPVKMTNSSGTIVWNAVWQPWGGAHALTGAEALNARFPGQWFQLEAGLHYNWHRHYDPSLGRYTQPDPLGLVDGPSVYAYAKGGPLQLSDFPGLGTAGQVIGGAAGGGAGLILGGPTGGRIGMSIGRRLGDWIEDMCFASTPPPELPKPKQCRLSQPPRPPGHIFNVSKTCYKCVYDCEGVGRGGEHITRFQKGGCKAHTSGWVPGYITEAKCDEHPDDDTSEVYEYGF